MYAFVFFFLLGSHNYSNSGHLSLTIIFTCQLRLLVNLVSSALSVRSCHASLCRVISVSLSVLRNKQSPHRQMDTFSKHPYSTREYRYERRDSYIKPSVWGSIEALFGYFGCSYVCFAKCCRFTTHNLAMYCVSVYDWILYENVV